MDSENNKDEPGEIQDNEGKRPQETQEHGGTGYGQINDGNRFDFMPIYYAVEVVFLKHYRANPKLKDKDVISALKRLRDNLNTPKFKFTQMEQEVRDNLDKEMAASDFSKRDVLMSLMRILNAVKSFHAKNGTRGYLEYIDANMKIIG